MILARTQPRLELCRELGNAMGGVAHDVPRLAGAGITGRHAARLARILLAYDFAVAYLNTGLREQAGNCRFLRVKTQRLNLICEILYRVVFVITYDHRNADGVDIGIQQIFPVPFRVHPKIVDHSGDRGFGYVFRDDAEVCPGVGSTLGELRFPRKLVGDIAMSRHLTSMRECSLGECRVAMKRLQSPRYAILIGCGKKKLLSNIRRGIEDGLRAQSWSDCKNQSRGNQHPACSARYTALWGGLHVADSRYPR